MGLGESTLKRWVDQGKIRAEKTPGGHRRIRLSEALVLLRAGEAPGADLATLGLADQNDASPGTLAAILCSDTPERALTLLEGLYAAGVRAPELADRWIAPAMRRIGRDWETERVAVTTEHRATAVMLRALHGLLRAQPTPAPTAPLALVSGLSGDPYLLAPLCVQLALCESGFQATNFGPDTPPAALCTAIAERRPSVVALSLSVPEASERAARSALSAACSASGSRLFVGGRGLRADHVRALSGAVWCRSLSDMQRISRRPSGGAPSRSGAHTG